MQVHPLGLGNPEFAGIGDAGQDHGGGLVNEGIGIHQLGVGKSDVRVRIADLRDLFGTKTGTSVSQRVFSRHLGKAREQIAHGTEVLFDGAAVVLADALFKQRIREDGTSHPMAVLDVVPTARGNPPLFRLRIAVLIPVQREIRPLCRFLGSQRFATRNERAGGLSARHHLKQAVDAPLRHVAARMGVDEARRRRHPESTCKRSRWIGVTTKRTGETPACV